MKKTYPWLANRIPNNLFYNKKILKEYFLWLFKKQKANTKNKKYKIGYDIIKKNHGGQIVDAGHNCYKTTNYRQIIIKIFPNLNLLEWKFQKIPWRYWEKKSNLLILAKYISKKHNFRNIKDWYKLTWKILVNDGSHQLVKIYPDGISFLKKIYPKYDWHPWFFERITGRIWRTKKFQLKYLNWFAKEKEIKKEIDWYKIELSDLKRLYARSLTRYHKTVYRIAKIHYPKFKFLAWKFKKIERGYFSKKENVLKYIHWIEKELAIKKKKDWYIHGYENIENNNGHSLLAKFSHSPLKILQYCYPKYPWDILRFGKTSKFEKQLYKLVKKLLKNKKIIHRYRSKLCRFKKSNRPMELDIYIPEFNVGIEFQGSQHFFAKWGKHELKEIKQRDKEKKITFKKNGIKILYVTYKWKGQKKPIINLLEKIKNF